MNAVVVAGGFASRDLADVAGEHRKGLIRLGGREALYYVLEALQGSRGVDKIALVGPEEMESLANGVTFVAEGTNVSQNILRGIGALGMEEVTEPVLVIPSDLPLLRSEDIEGFLARLPSGLGAAASFVRRERVEREQPGAPYTYIKVREGQFATGGITMVTPAVARCLADLIQQLHESRKSQLRVALMCGLGLLVRFRLGRLRIDEGVRAVRRLVGEDVWVDLDASPRTSLDLDGPEDYLYLRDNWDRLRSPQ